MEPCVGSAPLAKPGADFLTLKKIANAILEPCVGSAPLAKPGADFLTLKKIANAILEPCVGSAPTTCRLQGGCSTN